MTIRTVRCIHCGSEEVVVKMGYQKNGTLRCKCKNCKKTIQRDYMNKGAKPETKRLIIKMSISGSRIRGYIKSSRNK